LAIHLGPNQYGKAETRVVRVVRDGARHTLTDLNVSVSLAGDLAATHLTGDNSGVLTTDAQKNTVYAFAREHGIATPEEFALTLARHFAATQATVRRARVSVEAYAWERLGDHSFARRGQEVRTVSATVDAGGTGTETGGEWVVCGLRDLVVANTTDSEFWGYVKDPYTTLPETRDRILATAVDARWRHADPGPATDWEKSYAETRRLMLAAFTGTYSYSLQQTLYAMGRAALDGRPELAEVRLSLPNRHHFLVDLAPFGLDNPDEVYIAADRPYGLIEGSVLREGAPPAGPAWAETGAGLVT
jgi:urate oxidase